MLLPLLFAALPLGPATSAPPPEPSAGQVAPARTIGTDCPEAGVHMATGKARLVPRRLGELPPGRLELTVLREVDGCPIPAVLREGIGGGAAGEPTGDGRR